MNVKLTVVVMVAWWLGGCATSSSKLNGVHIGMAKADLVRRLGAPDTSRGQANIEYLTYYLKNDTSASNQPYMVRLIDTRVESFGRFISPPDLLDNPSKGTAALSVGAIMPYSMNMDVVTQLQHLKALQDQGVLTVDEVERAKQRLFSKVD